MLKTTMIQKVQTATLLYSAMMSNKNPNPINIYKQTVKVMHTILIKQRLLNKFTRINSNILEQEEGIRITSRLICLSSNNRQFTDKCLITHLRYQNLNTVDKAKENKLSQFYMILKKIGFKRILRIKKRMWRLLVLFLKYGKDCSSFQKIPSLHANSFPLRT